MRNTNWKNELGGRIGDLLHTTFNEVYSRLRRMERDIDSLSSVTTANIGNAIVRVGIVSLSAGANVISFSSPFQTDGYSLGKPLAYDSAGNSIMGDVTSRDKAGFTYLSPASGTLEYIGIELL